MNALDFFPDKKPCTFCPAFANTPNLKPRCLLDYEIHGYDFYYPVNPCNRPINSDELLDLLNSLFWSNNS